MDMLIFIILAVIYCTRTSIEEPVPTVVTTHMEVRLNPSYYHDETAFQLIYDRLKRGEIE